MLDEIQRVWITPRQNTRSCCRSWISRFDNEMEPDSRNMQKWPRKWPDALENVPKIAMWDPLSDPNLDQCSWWDEDSKYLPSRSEISEKTDCIHSFVWFWWKLFKRNGGMHKWSEGLPLIQHKLWKNIQKTEENQATRFGQIVDDPKWAAVDHNILYQETKIF